MVKGALLLALGRRLLSVLLLCLPLLVVSSLDLNSLNLGSLPRPLAGLTLATAKAAAGSGCSTVYQVQNKGSLSAIYVHQFTDGSGNSYYYYPSSIAAGQNSTYNLKDITEVPDGFTGSVTITSDQDLSASISYTDCGLSFSGHVYVNGTTQGVAGGIVRFNYFDGSAWGPGYSAQTDSSGAYWLPVPVAGKPYWDIHIDPPSSYSLDHPVAPTGAFVWNNSYIVFPNTTPSGAVAGNDFYLKAPPSPPTFSGHAYVKGSTQGIAGVTVRLNWYDGTAWGPGYSATSDSSGAWSFLSPLAGKPYWDIHADPPSGSSYTIDHPVGPTTGAFVWNNSYIVFPNTTPSGAVTGNEFYFKAPPSPPTFSGHAYVKGSTQGIAGVTVRLNWYDGTAWGPGYSATSDSSGAWSFLSPLAGKPYWDIHTDPPSGSSYTIDHPVGPATGAFVWNNSYIVFPNTTPSGAVTGNDFYFKAPPSPPTFGGHAYVKGTTQGIAGVIVRLNWYDGSAWGPGYSATSDSNGAWSFVSPLAGKPYWDIHADPPAGSLYTVDHPVAQTSAVIWNNSYIVFANTTPSGAVTGNDFYCKAPPSPPTFSGHAYVKGTTQGIAGVIVYLNYFDGANWGPGYSATTDANGAWSFAAPVVGKPYWDIHTDLSAAGHAFDHPLAPSPAISWNNRYIVYANTTPVGTVFGNDFFFQ